MTNHQPGPPGTVSKVLWHFTGGPNWDSSKKRQEPNPKRLSEAFNALCGILKTKQVRVGRYREVVIIHTTRHNFDRPTKVWSTSPATVELESVPVCCLSDIPIAHLSYHASRYGKIAIGFHRDAPVKAGFNPVFYSLHTSRALHTLLTGLRGLDGLDADTTDFIKHELQSKTTRLQCKMAHPVTVPRELNDEIDAYISLMAGLAGDANQKFKEFLAFVKTFNKDEFSTIYCGREWRSTQPFSFDIEDVAMIVIPKTGDESLFNRFMEEIVPEINLSRFVPIVPWEDLIEH